MMLAKLRKAWKSWTIWFNSMALAFVAFLPDLTASLPQVQDYLTPATYRALALAVFVVNMALRFKTKTDLSEK